MTARTTSYRDGEWDFWAIYDRDEWEPQTKAVLERFLQPGDLFCDIGAWIGPITLWAAGLGARVIAYEPDIQARRCLGENTRGLDVSIRPQAWSNHAGYGWLHPENYFGDSASKLGPAGIGAQPVTCVTPKQVFNTTFVEMGRPALIKVDIEGGEIDILPTLGPLCAKYRIPLLVAWHEPWWHHPVDLPTRESWFHGMQCDGDWYGWGQLLAVPT